MIYLSFDTEEFDVPCDYGVQYSPEKEGIEVSCYGTEKILDLLDRENVKATFFCTAVFASAKPDLIKRMVKSGHEIASHGYIVVATGFFPHEDGYRGPMSTTEQQIESMDWVEQEDLLRYL